MDINKAGAVVTGGASGLGEATAGRRVNLLLIGVTFEADAVRLVPGRF